MSMHDTFLASGGGVGQERCMCSVGTQLKKRRLFKMYKLLDTKTEGSLKV